MKHSGHKDHGTLRIVLTTLLACILLGVVGFVLLCVLWLSDLPDCSDVSDFNTAAAAEVYANDGQTVLARFQLEYREPIADLDQAGAYVPAATVATEDERFFSHSGVDPLSIARALVNNATGGTLEGASTITQQLVRNTVLADESTDITLKRKFREAFLALKLETMLSKEEILLLYINTINYGDGAYGIQAAAKHYFSKMPSELTLSEAALLVGIPQSPIYNNPVYYPEHAIARRNVVLSRLLSNGYISQEQYDAALAEDVVLSLSETGDDGLILYPYFASYVRQELYASCDFSTSDIFQGGMKVITTLDPSMQAIAEASASHKEEQLSSEFEVALVAIEPNTGYIRALVGGKNFYEDQYNLATQGQRMAGSAFKTFTLIAALEAGISPDASVNCSSKTKLGDWEVENIYGTNYGTRSMTRAFAVSSNTGFARIAASLGADTIAEVATRMGITSPLEADLTLTLGTSGVTPLEMASAYATIATGGVHFDPTAILQVYDRKGTVILDNSQPQGEQVISKEVACATIDVMRTVINSYEGTGTDARLSNGQDAVGKTGTSEEFKDSWFCGITPQLSVAVWMGDRDYASALPSNVNAANVFSSFLDRVLVGSETQAFPTAEAPSYTIYAIPSDYELNQKLEAQVE